MSDGTGTGDQVEVGALAITVAIPEHLGWTGTRAGAMWSAHRGLG